MKHIEAVAEYTDFLGITYRADKIHDNQSIKVILRRIDYSPCGVLSVVNYKDIGEELVSPFLNWRNVIFCSNNYGVCPDISYMNFAVQNGTKTTATAYPSGESSVKSIFESLPEDCFAEAYPDKDDPNPNMLYVYRSGTLADYFDFKQVKRLYEKHSIYEIDWDFVKSYFMKPFSFFADEDACGFSLQSGGGVRLRGNSINVINGLVLGYPLESTAAWISGNIKIYSDSVYSSLKKKALNHYKTNKTKFVDDECQTWLFDGNRVFIKGQQESLYY